MPTMTIGDFSKAAGINKETVRYYEHKRLLPRPTKGRNGYRTYDEHDLSRIRFISRAKDLGFTLKEISELLRLRVSSQAKAADIKAKTEHKIRQVEQKIIALEEIKLALIDVASKCDGKGAMGQCPIIEALEGRNACHV